MPRLSKTQATAVGKAEAWGSFAPVEPGLYAARLTSVEVKDGQEAPYWSWEYLLLDASRNAKVWDNTSLSDKAHGKLKAVFEAYDVPVTTDTDELIGNIMCLRVGQRTIQSGNRKGELTNSVEEILPIEDHPDYGTDAFLADGDHGGGRPSTQGVEEDPF